MGPARHSFLEIPSSDKGYLRYYTERFMIGLITLQNHPLRYDLKIPNKHIQHTSTPL